ncbi:bifunctional diguanylate cyclase/phosphodiesterase [Aromatoleum evansii]|uniref:bifunctional diguanylate cyclase/phosphodiesterase n=1 Tax=Aromatoleum evansii TaxID=59406 RepID=UPI00145EC42A|nr:EAL domain-containing protein [Aromatoleum evansii]NMG27563.1 EAL domain-containing protein [Aromatoleum evansii]
MIDPWAFVRRRRPLLVGLLVFVVTALVAGVLIAHFERQRIQVRRAEVADELFDKAQDLRSNVEHALAVTYALAALVRQGGGSIPNFDTLAEQMLPFYQGASALALAPGGVVRQIVPLAENSGVIGHDLLADPARNREAFLARDTGKLTLAGPFPLRQGGVGAVGRLPVYLPDESGRQAFWGFVAVVIRFPDVLETALLPSVEKYRFDYELWRTHPDTGARQVIAASSDRPLEQPVEHDVVVPNGVWTLGVVPVDGWGDDSPLPFELAAAALLCSALAWLAMSLMQLREHRRALQGVVAERTAELTAREARLAALITSLPDKMLLIDADRRITECHAPEPALLAAPVDQLLGRPYAETVPPEVAAKFDATIDAIAADGVPRQTEYALELADGVHHFSASISRLAGAEGSGGYIALARDISERVRMERALAESEMRYRALFANSRVVMLVIDPATGAIVDANDKACAYYGYGHAVLTRMSISDINVLSREEVLQEMARARARAADFFQFRHRLASGEVRDVEVASGPIEIEGRSLLYSIVQDVTERRRYEKLMREAMVVFNASSQAIMTTDADGVITSVNPAFCAITGYAPEEVIGHRSSMFKSGRHDQAFFESMWSRLAEAGAWEGEIWNRRKNGETYPQWLTITSVRDADGKVSEYVSLFSDITERKQQEEAMWRQANYDPLTGLANRSLLQDRLERALAQGRRHGSKVGLVFLDLDGFKWINDSLGHDVGDQLLIDVANRLQRCVRNQDTVARLGGDEFTVVVNDLHDQRDLEDLRAISEKLVAVLREPFQLRNAPHYISGSVGITVFPDDGDDVQSLLRNADIAMYKAKQAGKNRAQFYAPHMQADALARIQLETDLRTALEQEQFVLHYQPIVAATSGRVVGAEALIRWNHPRRGMVAPGEFIQVAEDCGLIVPIGEWALREAVRQSCAWREAGQSPLRIAVNVSGVQFREPGLPEIVRTLLPEGEGRAQLMLEITESVLMDGSEEAESRMREIRDYGIAYALDDFGTGFSSLSYLKRFPVDVVKIDRSFVRDCPDDHSDASLVEAIINMAHSLDLSVTAEGVESVEQRDFLRDLGCDFLQGYLIGKPLSPLEFAAFARANAPFVQDAAFAG